MNPVFDVQTQRVRIQLSDGSVGFYFGPVQFDVESVVGLEVTVLDIFPPTLLPDGKSWQPLTAKNTKGGE